jgi:hypothetical protein
MAYKTNRCLIHGDAAGLLLGVKHNYVQSLQPLIRRYTMSNCHECGYDIYKDYVHCPRCGSFFEMSDRCYGELDRTIILIERNGPRWFGVKVSDNLYVYGQPGQRGAVSARVVCGYVDCAIWWADMKDVHWYLSKVWDIPCPDNDTRYFEWTPETGVDLPELIRVELERDLALA